MDFQLMYCREELLCVNDNKRLPCLKNKKRKNIKTKTLMKNSCQIILKATGLHVSQRILLLMATAFTDTRLETAFSTVVQGYTNNWFLGSAAKLKVTIIIKNGLEWITCRTFLPLPYPNRKLVSFCVNKTLHFSYSLIKVKKQIAMFSL